MAGLTLAARLTEDQTKSVLVLEAGPANLDDPDIRKMSHPHLIALNQSV